MSLMQARVVLGLHPTGINVSWKLVEAAFKVRMLEAHPDKGGSRGAAQLVNAAHEMLGKFYNAAA